jgi:UDP:flavonoid glycosyltransferase YjiC (YdhE family)
MRVLFATTAGAGHFGPLIPFARAALSVGHEVAVAAPGAFESAVRGAGSLPAPATAMSWLEAVARS